MRTRGGPRAQDGFTLIELMVSLLVSSLLIAMVLAIFMRMSLSFRSQQEISNVQQRLSYAREWIETDARQAGLAMAPGFRIGADRVPGTWHSPVEIVNSSTDPDEISFYYADPSSQALVVSPTSTIGNWPAKVIVDAAAGFVAGDLIVMSTSSLSDSTVNAGEGKIARFSACVMQIASISATAITPTTALPWGSVSQQHCANPVEGKTMIYKFVARSYRIAPDRPELGALQLSTTGDLYGAGVFQDIAYDFTDLQVTGYFRDNDGLDSADPDLDPARDWYSSQAAQTFTTPVLTSVEFTPLLQVGFTLVARSSRDRDGISTSATPTLIDPVNITNNVLGDRPSVALPSATDLRLQGSRLYRYTTSYVDLRNVGVGR